jgi:hypothetical protein
MRTPTSEPESPSGPTRFVLALTGGHPLVRCPGNDFFRSGRRPSQRVRAISTRTARTTAGPDPAIGNRSRFRWSDAERATGIEPGEDPRHMGPASARRDLLDPLLGGVGQAGCVGEVDPEDVDRRWTPDRPGTGVVMAARAVQEPLPVWIGDPGADVGGISRDQAVVTVRELLNRGHRRRRQPGRQARPERAGASGAARSPNTSRPVRSASVAYPADALATVTRGTLGRRVTPSAA